MSDSRRGRPYSGRVQSSPAIEALADAVEAGGLIDRRSAGVVLVSGGPDSACAAAALVALCGPESISAVSPSQSLSVPAVAQASGAPGYVAADMSSQSIWLDSCAR